LRAWAARIESKIAPNSVSLVAMGLDRAATWIGETLAPRHIGGSLLPSNEVRILRPVETSFGTLQVRVIAELDTHGLFCGESLLASHPNGYSCHALLEYMVAGNTDRARDQVKHILDCGGTARHTDHIVNTMKTKRAALPPCPL
jgi:hypothetical protein